MIIMQEILIYVEAATWYGRAVEAGQSEYLGRRHGNDVGD